VSSRHLRAQLLNVACPDQWHITGNDQHRLPAGILQLGSSEIDRGGFSALGRLTNYSYAGTSSNLGYSVIGGDDEKLAST
jgi:hypothetical protein